MANTAKRVSTVTQIRPPSQVVRCDSLLLAAVTDVATQRPEHGASQHNEHEHTTHLIKHGHTRVESQKTSQSVSGNSNGLRARPRHKLAARSSGRVAGVAAGGWHSVAWFSTLLLCCLVIDRVASDAAWSPLRVPRCPRRLGGEQWSSAQACTEPLCVLAIELWPMAHLCF